MVHFGERFVTIELTLMLAAVIRLASWSSRDKGDPYDSFLWLNLMQVRSRQVV